MLLEVLQTDVRVVASPSPRNGRPVATGLKSKNDRANAHTSGSSVKTAK